MKQLAGLPKLTCLRLAETAVGDAGLAEIVKIGSLEELDLELLANQRRGADAVEEPQEAQEAQHRLGGCRGGRRGRLAGSHPEAADSAVALAWWLAIRSIELQNKISVVSVDGETDSLGCAGPASFGPRCEGAPWRRRLRSRQEMTTALVQRVSCCKASIRTCWRFWSCGIPHGTRAQNVLARTFFALGAAFCCGSCSNTEL